MGRGKHKSGKELRQFRTGLRDYLDKDPLSEDERVVPDLCTWHTCQRKRVDGWLCEQHAKLDKLLKGVTK